MDVPAAPMRATILLLCLPTLSLAESLDDSERKELHAYLTELKNGRPGSAAQVERLAEVSYAGLTDTIRTSAELTDPIEGHTQRAFQALLERLSREAHSPWPLPELDAVLKQIAASPASQPRTAGTGASG